MKLLEMWQEPFLPLLIKCPCLHIHCYYWEKGENLWSFYFNFVINWQLIMEASKIMNFKFHPVELQNLQKKTKNFGFKFWQCFNVTQFSLEAYLARAKLREVRQWGVWCSIETGKWENEPALLCFQFIYIMLSKRTPLVPTIIAVSLAAIVQGRHKTCCSLPMTAYN